MTAGLDASFIWKPSATDVSIDIIGSCPLSCPACGHGQFPATARYQGVMREELFAQILDKLEREFSPEKPTISLFNWGEPLSHPRASDFIKMVKARGWTCLLSSNLVRPRNLREVVAARPDWLRISVSGFTQATYGLTHRNGDIERVKRNMRELREYMDQLESKLVVEIYYHRYRHNGGAELESMRGLATELSFRFQTVWSIAGSPEKVISWLESGVPEADREHIGRLIHRPEDSRAISEKYRHLLRDGECPLREPTSINADGSVDLCCAAYEVRPIASSFLAVPRDELRRRKDAHALCTPCMRHALHLTALAAGGEERDAFAEAVLMESQGPRQT